VSVSVVVDLAVVSAAKEATMGIIEEKLCRDLGLRGMRPNTVSTYVRCCRRFEEHFGRSSLELSIADVRAYLDHLRVQERKSARTINVYAAALAFLFGQTLDRPIEVGRIPRMRWRARLPTVLSAMEIEKLLGALSTPRQRAVVLVMYGAGLRISEALALHIEDIDSQRMQLRVRDGKGGRDRNVPLSPRLLAELRAYYRHYRPSGPLLFTGRNRQEPLARMAINKALRTAARKIGLDKRVSPHALRHSFATHLLELGTDIRSVQVLLGHAALRSTTTYLHVSQAMLSKVTLPVDKLGAQRGPTLS
jgi:site-specific recombinase XerD